jgi:hypothetical protein
MTTGEFTFVLMMWWAIERFATVAATAADEGRSWMECFAIAGRDQVVWLQAL